MSVSGISSSSFYAPSNPTSTQNNFQQIQQDFQEIGQDLQEGNLSQAQSAFSALTQLLPSQFQPTSSTSGTTQSGSSSNPIQQALQQLGSDLQSGNLSAAQSDYGTLQQDVQSAHAAHGHHHHMHGGQNGQSNQDSPASLLNELGQALQSGNLSSAQQTYATLQQEFSQYPGAGSSTGSSSTPTSGSLNVAA
jgi:hypothetical protein